MGPPSKGQVGGPTTYKRRPRYGPREYYGTTGHPVVLSYDRSKSMPSRALHFCKHPGCNQLTTERYCPEHAGDQQEADKRYDMRRGTAAERGYKWRWQKASKWFLRQPGNQICKLHLPGCTLIANCVDHIDPPDGPDDPRFWDERNWQAACIHCNSVKGHKKIVGKYDMMEEI